MRQGPCAAGSGCGARNQPCTYVAQQASVASYSVIHRCSNQCCHSQHRSRLTLTRPKVQTPTHGNSEDCAHCPSPTWGWAMQAGNIRPADRNMLTANRRVSECTVRRWALTRVARGRHQWVLRGRMQSRGWQWWAAGCCGMTGHAPQTGKASRVYCRAPPPLPRSTGMPQWRKRKGLSVLESILDKAVCC